MNQFSLNHIKNSLFRSLARHCLRPVHFIFAFFTPFSVPVMTHNAMSFNILVLETHWNCDHQLIVMRKVCFDKLVECIVQVNYLIHRVLSPHVNTNRMEQVRSWPRRSEDSGARWKTDNRHRVPIHG